MKEEQLLIEKIILKDRKQIDALHQMIKSLGVDKCVEIYKNLDKLVNAKIPFGLFFEFAYYDIELSEILFTILRHQENHVKAFLCNAFNDYQIQIEERPSNYSKAKYYFKIPVGVNKYLDIRTHNYECGPIDYYDAIKTLDFYDVNLIMSHLPISMVKQFSTNPNIISDLDKTRQLRNYVYHHNMLYSLGKDELKHSIVLVLKNLPSDNLKRLYIDKINSLRLCNKERENIIDDNISIIISKFDEEEIFKY